MRSCIALLAAIVWTALKSTGQALPGNFNLIPNPSFEFNTTGTIVNDTDFVDNPICWAKANSYSYPFVNNSLLGNGYAHSGATFAGLVTGYPQLNLATGQWTDTLWGIRTYYQSRLLQPLVAGRTYRFEIFAGAEKNPNLDVLGNIGVYFSTVKLSDYANVNRIARTPQVRFTNWTLPATSNFTWVRLRATFVATGGEQFMTIGNFDTSTQLHLVYLSDSSIARGYSQPYFNNLFIDDVSLVSDTTQAVVSLSLFSLGNDTAICPGSEAVLGGEPYFLHYWWNTGDTTRNIRVTQPGTYTCTVDYGCGNYTDTVKVSYLQAPNGFMLPDSVLCGGAAFNARGPAGYAGYAWSNGATTQNTTFNGQGTYWLRATNSCGVTFTDTFTLVSMPSTTPGININTVPPTILCAGSEITFITNSVGAGSNPRYQWYKNNNRIPGATGTTYRDAALADQDTITVLMYSSASCPTTYPTISNKVGVNVSPNAVPEVSISASPGTYIIPGQAVTFTASSVNSGNSPVYTWYLNGNIVAGTAGSTWTTNALRGGDAVTARLESTMPCAFPPLVYANVLIMAAQTGIGQINGTAADIVVYPNPVADLLHVDLLASALQATLAIYDGYGRKVTAVIRLYQQKNTLDIGYLSPGLYTYSITQNSEVYHGRFLKK